MRTFIVFVFMLVMMPIHGQLKLRNYVFDIEGLLSVQKFYEENISRISQLNGDTITAVDIILYGDAVTKYNSLGLADHIYALYQQYTFIEGKNTEGMSFYVRSERSPKRFIVIPTEEVNKIQMYGDFKHIYMPCKFIIRINGDKVSFERVIKAREYIEEDFK